MTLHHPVLRRIGRVVPRSTLRREPASYVESRRNFLLLPVASGIALAVMPARAEGGQGLDLLLIFAPPESSWRDQRRACEALQQQLVAAVQAARAGDYDGHESGGDEFTMHFTGASADALWKVAEPIVKRSPASRGGKAVLVYGARSIERKL